MDSTSRRTSARRFLVGIVLAIAVLVGAQAWAARSTPPPVPPSLAMLWIAPKSNIYIKTVDGREMTQSSFESQKEVLLAPGHHVVTGIVYTAGSGISYRSEFDVEAGVRYGLRAKTSSYQVVVEIHPLGANPGAVSSPAIEPTTGYKAGPATASEAPAADAMLHLGQATDVISKRGNVKRGLTALLIDDTSPATGFWSPEHPRDIRIAAGKHVVKLGLVDVTTGLIRRGEALLWFVAAPGAEYHARYTLGARGFNVWIEDADGQRVGGLVGSVDEPH